MCRDKQGASAEGCLGMQTSKAIIDDTTFWKIEKALKDPEKAVNSGNGEKRNLIPPSVL